MRFERYDFSNACPVEAALELIGGKWKGMALYHLLDGKKRFNELKRHVGGVTKRMLTKQLRELKARGLISRHVYAEAPKQHACHGIRQRRQAPDEPWPRSSG